LMHPNVGPIMVRALSSQTSTQTATQTTTPNWAAPERTPNAIERSRHEQPERVTPSIHS
jgi:hypothetical protein